MGREVRDSRGGDGTSRWRVALIVGGAGALVAVSVVASVTGRPWVFEALAGLGLLAGLGVACGAFDRRPARSAAAREGQPATPTLRAAVDERLGTLDRLEHRRLDLGAPWPSVVIGPTGVAVIAPASVAHGLVVRRLAAVVAEVRGSLAGTAGGVLPVRGLLVMDRPEVDRVVDLADEPVSRITADQLLDTLARGTLTRMTVVEEAYGRLAGTLAPDLSTGAKVSSRRR